MRRITQLTVATVLFGLAARCHAQTDDAGAAIQKALNRQYTSAKLSNDKKEIVTAGSILVLQKDGLLTYSADVAAAPVNTYKSGKLSQGFGDMLTVDMIDGMNRSGGPSSIPKKKLVAGEKFWLVGSSVLKDKLVFAVITDSYDDGRYFAQIKFPFAKGATPSPDEVLKTIAEVVSVQPAPPAAPPVPTPPPPEQAMAPIAPPPPPSDAPPAPPKSISLGQTKDQVAATFGMPQKVVTLGAKEILYYPDMKVTFVDGKVSDVQ